MDPRAAALDDLHRLLATAGRRPLRAQECSRAVELVAAVPGYARRVAAALSAQRDAAAADALRQLPPQIPGVVEGLCGAFAQGVTRTRPDGEPGAAVLAMDFRKSRSKGFEDLLGRVYDVFGADAEALTVDGRPHYRFAITDGRGTLAGHAAAAAADLMWLHPRLARLRGTRLWINGWCFADDGPVRPAVQVHLVRAWLRWAAGQTNTRVGDGEGHGR